MLHGIHYYALNHLRKHTRKFWQHDNNRRGSSSLQATEMVRIKDQVARMALVHNSVSITLIDSCEYPKHWSMLLSISTKVDVDVVGLDWDWW